MYVAGCSNPENVPVERKLEAAATAAAASIDLKTRSALLRCSGGSLSPYAQTSIFTVILPSTASDSGPLVMITSAELKLVMFYLCTSVCPQNYTKRWGKPHRGLPPWRGGGAHAPMTRTIF